MIIGYQLWLLHSLLLPAFLFSAAMLWPVPSDPYGTEISTKG